MWMFPFKICIVCIFVVKYQVAHALNYVHTYEMHVPKHSTQLSKNIYLTLGYFDSCNAV